VHWISVQHQQSLSLTTNPISEYREKARARPAASLLRSCSYYCPVEAVPRKASSLYLLPANVFNRDNCSVSSCLASSGVSVRCCHVEFSPNPVLNSYHAACISPSPCVPSSTLGDPWRFRTPRSRPLPGSQAPLCRSSQQALFRGPNRPNKAAQRTTQQPLLQ